jgi:predicted HTH transcriptional regulator
MLKDSWHCSENAIKWVRKAFEEINQKTIEKNVMEGSNEPLVECERVVMYTARHTAANHLLNTPNITVSELATILARSPNTISTYIHQLTNDEEIASITKNMPI